MNKSLYPLDQMPIGTLCQVKALTLKDITRRRILDLGLIDDTIIRSLRKSPAGDPIAYEIRGTVIALRSEEAAQIYVRFLEEV